MMPNIYQIGIIPRNIALNNISILYYSFILKNSGIAKPRNEFTQASDTWYIYVEYIQVKIDKKWIIHSTIPTFE